MKRELNLGLIVFLLALLPRVGWIALRWAQVGPQLEFPDEQIHWQLATNLALNGALVTDDGRFVARMPLYPMLLAPFALWGSVGVLGAKLLQAALGAAAAWLSLRFGSAALGRRAGVIAGILVAIDPFGVFFSNLLLTESPFVPVIIAATASAWYLAADPARRDPCNTLGLSLFGVAAIFLRPASTPWVFALWLCLVVMDRLRWRTMLRIAICALVLALALIPWGLRNRSVVGDFAWLSANGGVTLYDAQGPQANGASNQSFLEEMPELRGLNELALDQRLQLRAIDQMKRDPGRVLSLAAVKFSRLWNLVPNLESYRGSAAAIANAVFTGIVLLAALIGMIRLMAGRRHIAMRNAAIGRWLVLVILPVVVFTLLHCIYIGSVRYRVPLMPFVELLAAAAFAHWAKAPGAGNDAAEPAPNG